jgi:hypothetical protein
VAGFALVTDLAPEACTTVVARLVLHGSSAIAGLQSHTVGVRAATLEAVATALAGADATMAAAKTSPTPPDNQERSRDDLTGIMTDIVSLHHR